MADKEVPGLNLSEEARKMKNDIIVKEAELRVLKLEARKKDLEVEIAKIDYEIKNLTDNLKKE